MHSLLPVTLSRTTFSTANDIVQKTNRLNDKIVFFPPSLCSLKVGGSTKVLLRVATCSSLQDTLPPLLFRTLPSHTVDMIVEGAGRILKTR